MNFLGYHTVVCWEEGSVAVVSFLHKDQKEEDLMDHYQVCLFYPLTNILTTRHLVKMVYLDLMRKMQHMCRLWNEQIFSAKTIVTLKHA